MMRIAAALLVLSLGLTSQVHAEDQEITDENKVFYALGQGLAGQVAIFRLNESELELVKQGFTDAVLNREPKAKLQDVREEVQALVQERAALAAEEGKKAGAEYLAKAATEDGAVKTESGMVIQEITPGTGESPTPTSTVKVHYHGTLIDGTVFDSSVDRGKPATFPLNGVIKCWTEGLQQMKVGGKSRLICPSDLAYGDAGRGPTIKPGSTLVFEVELLEIVAPTE